MKGKIAIEPALSNVKEYLTGEGYDVVNMNSNEHSEKNLDAFDAILVTGLNTNLLGIATTDTKAVVINVDGLTPDEVGKKLREIKSS